MAGLALISGEGPSVPRTPALSVAATFPSKTPLVTLATGWADGRPEPAWPLPRTDPATRWCRDAPHQLTEQAAPQPSPMELVGDSGRSGAPESSAGRGSHSCSPSFVLVTFGLKPELESQDCPAAGAGHLDRRGCDWWRKEDPDLTEEALATRTRPGLGVSRPGLSPGLPLASPAPPDELWAWKVAAQLAVATPGDFSHWVHWPAVPTG